MTEVDTGGLYQGLRDLLYEPLQRAFLRRDQKASPTRPSRTIEAATRHLVFDRPRMRDRISKIVDEHVIDNVRPRLPTHNVYTPELLKEMILDIGREAWALRYDGPLEVELKVRAAEVSLHWMRHPGSTAAARLA